MNAHKILTMPSSEIRKRVRYLNSTALWGRDGGRQFGSPVDLAISKAERDGFALLRRQLEAFARIQRQMMSTAAEFSAQMAKIGRVLATPPEETARRLDDLKQNLDRLSDVR